LAAALTGAVGVASTLSASSSSGSLAGALVSGASFLATGAFGAASS